MGAARKPVSPHVWVPTTYFAEGFPYTVVNSVAEVFLQQMGASLGAVGLTSLLHLPWNLKLFWAPLVDTLGTQRGWQCAMQFSGALLLGALAAVSAVPLGLTIASILFVLLALASATNDIAIDGYYMAALDSREQSRFVGYRAMAYKVSSLIVRGPLLGLCGLLGWSLGFLTMALVLLFVAAVHLAVLPRQDRTGLGASEVAALLRERRPQVIRQGGRILILVLLGALLGPPLGRALGRVPVLQDVSVAGWVGFLLALGLGLGVAFLGRLKRRLRETGGPFGTAVVQLLDHEGMGAALAFVILFRTGESFLQKMKFPFLSGTLGLSVEDYAFANGTLGVLASFVGTFVGGALIARDGIRRWFWPFLLAQNLLNLLYVGLSLSASWGASGDASASLAGAFGQSPLALTTFVIGVEEFGAGLGTAVFMVYLMRLCHPDHQATHFAILTALMSLSFTFAGSFSGFLAEATGFSSYFFITFVATWPMMLLAPKALRVIPAT